MAPPGGQTAARTRRNHVNGGTDTSVSAALISCYVALAKAQPAMADVPASTVGRIVRRFIAASLHERDLTAWVIAYNDPTGEQAVRNVMRGTG